MSSDLSSATITPNVSIDERVDKYVKENNPCVYILTPCFASLCYVNYVNSLMNTILMFQDFNIKYKIEFCKNDSLVSRARNNLVAKAMNDPNMTHIMFIDNDITWDPRDILKLIISNKPIVGGIYPLKHYNWQNVISDRRNPANDNAVKTLIEKKTILNSRTQSPMNQ